MYKIVLLSKDRDYKELMKSYFENSESIIVSFNTIDELSDYLYNNYTDILICDLTFGSISINQVKEIVRDNNITLIALNDTFDNIDLKVYIDSSIKEFINKKEDLKLVEQRIHNLMLAQNYTEEKIVKLKDKSEKIVLNKEHQAVYKEDKRFSVTKLEMELIECLLKRKNKPITREEICKEVWLENEGNIRKVDTCIKNIRKKLDIKSIKTIYGKGYVWKD